MGNDLTNLKAMVHRHTTPMALGVYILFAILFFPRLWDLAMGEPWVDNRLSILKTSEGSYLIEDTIVTRSSVYGDRQITLEDPDGVVLCSARWSGAWQATSKRNWAMSALTGNCQLPTGIFKVCSRFSIYSQSGRHRTFDPFCSEPTSFVPVMEPDKP